MNNKKDGPEPIGQITLLNGNVLDCYSPDSCRYSVNHGLFDVDSNEYKSKMKSDKLRSLWTAYSDEANLQLFLNNAYLFLDSSNLVLEDSRIFLTPIPIVNKLLFKDDRALQKPILGAFIEWWSNCHSADFMDSNWKEWIIYRLSGCPLTGRNKCSLLNRKGETRQASVMSFNDAWKSFAKINSRYEEAKKNFGAYNNAVQALRKPRTGKYRRIYRPFAVCGRDARINKHAPSL